jgi:hypothetical protein
MPWWFADRGKPRQGKRQGQATKRPDPPFFGNAMRAKTTPQKPKRKKAKTNLTFAYVSSTLSMATHNLISMVAVTVVSGAVLLTLLVARHF